MPQQNPSWSGRLKATLRGRNGAGEADLDGLDAVGEVVVTLCQGEDAMPVVRQHHPGIDSERALPSRASNRIAQGIDVASQQIRLPLEKVNREEIRPARHAEAAVV